VRLEFTVKADGTVTDIKSVDAGTGVISGYLQKACTKALSRWTYNPYLVKGEPTAMRATVQFKFSYPGGLEITYP